MEAVVDPEMTTGARDLTEERTGPTVAATEAKIHVMEVKTEVIEEIEETEATTGQTTAETAAEEDSRDLTTGTSARSDPITSSVEAVVAVKTKTAEVAAATEEEATEMVAIEAEVVAMVEAEAAVEMVAAATSDRDSKEAAEEASTTGLPNHSCPCLQVPETLGLKQSVSLQTSLG